MSMSVDMHPRDHEAKNYRVSASGHYTEWPDQFAVTINTGDGEYVVMHTFTADQVDRLADDLKAIAAKMSPATARIEALAEALTDPKAFVDGMIKEPAVIHRGLPEHIQRHL